MNKLASLFVALVALTSASCTQAEISKFQTIYSVATTAQVPAQDIVAAAYTFGIIKAAATSYLVFCKSHLKTPACSAGNRRIVIKAGRQGTAARNQLLAAISNGAPAGPRTLFDAMVTATTTLQSSQAQGFVDPSAPPAALPPASPGLIAIPQ